MAVTIASVDVYKSDISDQHADGRNFSFSVCDPGECVRFFDICREIVRTDDRSVRKCSDCHDNWTDCIITHRDRETETARKGWDVLDQSSSD